MTLAWKRVAICVAAISLCAAIVVLFFAPNHTGYTGMTTRRIDGQPALVLVTAVRASSPAARAGLRAGDVIDAARMSPAQALRLVYIREDQPVTLAMQRGNGTAPITIVATSAHRAMNGVQLLVGDALLVLYIVLAAFMTFRAGERAEARAIAGFLFWSAANSIMQQVVPATPTASAAAFAGASQDLTALFIDYYAMLLACVFPPRDTVIAGWLRRIFWPFLGAIAAGQVYYFVAKFYPGLDVIIAGRQVSRMLFWLPLFAGFAAFWIGMLDGLLHGDRRYRAQMLWIVVSLLSATIIECIRGAFYGFALSTPAWVGNLEFFEAVAPFGAVYAVLRHKLVDLQVVVSRATVFGIVSVILVALFVGVEWLAGVIAEATVGHLSGLSSEITGLLIAVAIGLSARAIHTRVEHTLNEAFFRKHRRNLEALRRFARETDVATHAHKLIAAAHETLCRHVESEYNGIYLQRDGIYEREFGPADELPEALDENHPLLLRLRRFAEPFDVDANDGAFAHCLLLPMTVLGRTVGFVVAGPKHDRTQYLREEVETLAALAHRVGTVYWLLQPGAVEHTLPALL